jgi:hypothetical protein
MDDEHQRRDSDGIATHTAVGNGLLALQEAALRQFAGTDPLFDIAVHPLVERDLLWWRLALQFPGDPRELRLVDTCLRDRRWKQLNALARFVCRSCGDGRRLIVSLKGIDPDRLTTRGEKT